MTFWMAKDAEMPLETMGYMELVALKKRRYSVRKQRRPRRHVRGIINDPLLDKMDVVHLVEGYRPAESVQLAEILRAMGRAGIIHYSKLLTNPKCIDKFDWLLTKRRPRKMFTYTYLSLKQMEYDIEE